jgi:hypothetical protein
MLRGAVPAHAARQPGSHYFVNDSQWDLQQRTRVILGLTLLSFGTCDEISDFNASTQCSHPMVTNTLDGIGDRRASGTSGAIPAALRWAAGSVVIGRDYLA